MIENPLHILQVSTFDIQGGAEKVAWNLFDAYRKRGYPSWLAVGEKRSDDPDVLLIPNQVSRGRWFNFWREVSSFLYRSIEWKRAADLVRLLANGLAEPTRAFDIIRGFEDFRFPGTSRLLSLPSQKPDIVHCHNLHGGYFDLRMLPGLSHQVPLVITLHDAWLLSGHCAHSFECDRWQAGCGHCPDLTIYPAIQRDATAYNWQRKREIYTRSRLYIATPSCWLMNKVEKSVLAPAVVENRVVPNGVDLSIFHPANRQAARNALGISQAARVLLTTGVRIHQNIWKDYSTLRNAITLVARHMTEEDLVLMVLGEDAPPERSERLEIRFIPYQGDQRKVALFCNAADIYVHAARADTFPTSVVEAMACGVPVVATAVGGIPEQVEDNRTGFLAPMGDAQMLATRIIQILSDDLMRREMGLKAVEKARWQYSFGQMEAIYLSWYEELTSDGKVVIPTEKTYALS